MEMQTLWRGAVAKKGRYIGCAFLTVKVRLGSIRVSLNHDGTDGTGIQSVSPVQSVSNSRSN